MAYFASLAHWPAKVLQTWLACNNMARPRPKKRTRQDEPAQADFYEAEEREPDEEKFSGQRYDVCPLLC